MIIMFMGRLYTKLAYRLTNWGEFLWIKFDIVLKLFRETSKKIDILRNLIEIDKFKSIYSYFLSNPFQAAGYLIKLLVLQPSIYIHTC